MSVQKAGIYWILSVQYSYFNTYLIGSRNRASTTWSLVKSYQSSISTTIIALPRLQIASETILQQKIVTILLQ